MTEYAGLPLIIKTHPRAKRVLVKLIPNQGLEVVTPRGFDRRFVPEILDEKRRWIERTRDRLLAEGRDLSGKMPRLPNTMDYKCAGRIVQIDYIDRQVPAKIVENASRLQVSGPVDRRDILFEALQKYTVKKARQVLLPMLESMGHKTGLRYSALRVRRQKTRWGSCSAKGTISLNAKLIFLPQELVEHLILHELCHTRHLNHSKAYWACVGSFQPDYVRLENEIRLAGKYVPRWFG